MASKAFLEKAYLAYFGRPVDYTGAADYAKTSEADVVKSFSSSPESQALYGSNFGITQINAIYNMLFGRSAEPAGLDYWYNQVKTGLVTPAGAAVAILEGAKNADAAAVTNKLAASAAFTASLDTTPEIVGYSGDAAAGAARVFLQSVTTTAATQAAVDAAVTTTVSGTGSGSGSAPIALTAGTDRVTGTSGADTFEAFLSQNSIAGGVSNTLSSADRVAGGAGADSLYAELVPEFFGITGNNQIDVQPRISGVEKIELEARDAGSNLINTVGETISVDAKYITGHDSIGSKFSDGDLVIENLTTLTDAGKARNTDSITITMDHTDNFNSDGDASDLTVYFDEDYLLAGQTNSDTAFYFLEDREGAAKNPAKPLARINTDGLKFTVNGVAKVISLTTAQMDTFQTSDGTWTGYTNLMKAALATAAATDPSLADLTLELSTTVFREKGLDGTTLPVPAPAIVLSSTVSVIESTGFRNQADAPGQYDVFAVIDNKAQATAALPVTVNIDLHKVGREGEGGNLIVGGKESDLDGGRDNQGKGITVFNVDVMGDASKPSNLGTLNSTNGDLEVINIATHADYLAGTSFASLNIRDGFGDAGNKTIRGQVNLDNDLKAVNATQFKGNLTLGEDVAVVNLDTLNATGGGKIDFTAVINGTEKDQAYVYTTGANDDKVNVTVLGNAVDFAKSSVSIVTGAGKDVVNLTTAMFDGQSNQVLNQVILKNVAIDTGADDDIVTLAGGSQGDVTINTGAGNDVVYTAGGATAVWAFNYDDARTAVTSLGGTAADNLPGVQTSLAFLSGATVRVTLSGAGLAAAAGGGVMAVNDINANGNLLADEGGDGYEAQTTIGSLINGNQYFGDQRDINAAIVKIITEDATLSKLLTAKIGANNTLVVATKTGGNFNTSDLEITLTQRTAGTTTQPGFAAAVLSEAEIVFKKSSLTLTDLWGSETPAEGATFVGENDGAGKLGNDATVLSKVEQNDYYTGLGIDNATLHTAGAASTTETDTIINGGTGNDVIVLSTDAVGGGVAAFTLSSNNRLLNGASNETIKLTEANFGNDVVMNFTADATQAGVDFLDYGFYLTSKVSTSGSTASTQVIPVTLDVNVAGVVANEVSVIRFDNTDATDRAETFAALTAAQIASLFNFKTGDLLGTNTQIGNLVAGTFSVKTDYDDANTAGSPSIDLINGAAKSVVMVENADNLGMYKVFELSWYGGVTDVASTHTVTVVDLGSLDFGTSLVGMTSTNLAGSALNKALSLNGPVAAPATYAISGAATAAEGTSATFTVNTTNVANGTVLAYTLSGVGITAADVTGGALTGSVTITGNTGTITVPLAADLTTEGNETLTATVMTASASTTVVDTSLTPGAGTALPTGAGGVSVVAATPAADNFTFDVAAALGIAANTQIDLNSFAPAADKLTIDLPLLNAAITNLAQLAGQQGVTVSDNPFLVPGGLTINFGSDFDGDPVVINLTGVTLADAATVAVTII